MFGRRKVRVERQRVPSSDGAFEGLRSMALDAVAGGLTAPLPDHPDVSGFVVDVPASGGFATVVALTDGTTSMYTSTGGGTIGAGAHAEVAAATRHLLIEAQRNLAQFRNQDEPGLPPVGLVRMHVLTPHDRRTIDVPENAFWGREPHELMPVIASVQAVISAISAASAQGA